MGRQDSRTLACRGPQSTRAFARLASSSSGFGIIGNPMYRVIKIDGGSMEPTIARGDLIVVTAGTRTSRARPDRRHDGWAGGRDPPRRRRQRDGTIATRGDANRVSDDWGSQQVKVVGLYVATFPWLGAVLPVPSVSAASFADQVTASMSITVGSWPTPPPRPPRPNVAA